MDKIQELLKVLDMSEEEQWNWLIKHKHISALYKKAVVKSRRQILADLAFRLRYEAVKLGYDDLAVAYWERAKILVWDYRLDKKQKDISKIAAPYFLDKLNLATNYFADNNTPIDTIIAALIAKELDSATS